MKYRLLEILCCPACQGDLQLEIYKKEQLDDKVVGSATSLCRKHCGFHNLPVNEIKPTGCSGCYQVEILEGKLICKCGYACPVINGIPRILPYELLIETLSQYHHEYVESYLKESSDNNPAIASTKKKIATMHAFGYQWTTFVENFDYYRDVFLGFVRPHLDQDDFKDKLVLDVGCGSGRPASVACSLGAEVIAVDLSEAVETAYLQSKHYPKLHAIQGDAYSLPVKPCFDFVYSVGVLQHLPEPANALKSIARTVPMGHKLVLWVYGKRELWYQPIEWLRKFTRKMSYRSLHVLSYILAVLSEIFLLIPYRILSKFDLTKPISGKIPGRIYAGLPFKENLIGWFDRLSAPVTYYFSRDDVEHMLSDAGFNEINIVSRPDASASWVAKAVRTK